MEVGAEGGAVTVGTPEDSEGAPVLFVIMPFVERDDRHETGFFKEVIDELFIPAGKEAGFTVRTAKRQGSDVIQSTIVNDLLEADLVLADLTEHNPNVLGPSPEPSTETCIGCGLASGPPESGFDGVLYLPTPVGSLSAPWPGELSISPVARGRSREQRPQYHSREEVWRLWSLLQSSPFNKTPGNRT
jgi:hypothetical protein